MAVIREVRNWREDGRWSVGGCVESDGDEFSGSGG